MAQVAKVIVRSIEGVMIEILSIMVRHQNHTERDLSTSFSKSMSKQRRGNERPSTGLINANNVEAKKAIIHFHDWLLSKS